MKNTVIPVLFLICISSCGTNTTQNDTPADIKTVDQANLIPYPVSVEEKEGFFAINGETCLYFDESLAKEGEYLNSLISTNCNIPLKVNSETEISQNSIHLILSDTPIAPDENREAYTLNISNDELVIEANYTPGIMRGIQTLRQLFVPEFHNGKKRDNWYLPALAISDYPEFEHRGLLLDVCRHFFEKDVVMKYIDALAYYKMNVLHFHLTEDQGWRVPIEKYPLLNEISAWRTDSSGNQYGGYYTREELIEIVDYAAERHITVIPEIELPGHSQAALAAYPQFSCNGGPIEVANDWGVFKEIYCAGNDSTFIFLEDILTEVMAIFPSEYIHIGGDEAPKFRWEHCPKCQRRMREEGLKDEHELQSYFIRRIEGFLNENGRKLIGWDEILEGGLSENATVQSWRGMEGGKTAAETKHNVIMSPTSHCYLDYSLSAIDLKKIYEFDPVPENLDAEFDSYILGGECNMWTERVPTTENLDAKVFPRMIGLAEALWSYPETRDFDGFYNRLQSHYPVLEIFGIQYGLETIGATITQKFTDSTVHILLNKNLPDLDLKYSWPDTSNYTLYETGLPFEKSGTLYAQAYKNDAIYGAAVMQKFEHHKGINKPVTYQSAYNQWYEGASLERSLIDGRIGALNFRDGNWQGFWGENVDVIIDMVTPTEITAVKASFYQYANAWIFLPTQLKAELSDDGEIWHTTMEVNHTGIDLSNTQSIETMTCVPSVGGKGFPKARYIRVQVKNLGKVPDGHEAAGQPAWIFIDEIIVE